MNRRLLSLETEVMNLKTSINEKVNEEDIVLGEHDNDKVELDAQGNDWIIKCFICDIVFKNRDENDKHMNEAHASIVQLDGSAEMEPGNSKFKSRINERGWIVFDLPYKCDECDFQSSAEYHLTQHKNKKHKSVKSKKTKQKRANNIM